MESLTTSPPAAGTARRWATHPWAPVAVLAIAALAALAWRLAGHNVGMLPWVVLALAAGYAISGSV